MKYWHRRRLLEGLNWVSGRRGSRFQALSSLDRRCQFLIESFYVNGMSQAELAKRLKIQAQSVPVLLSRCREVLKNRPKK